MKYNIIFLFVIIISLATCTNNKDEQKEKEAKKINIPKEDELLSIPQDLMHDIEFTRLETDSTCLIGEIDKLLVHKGKYYILDKNNHQLLVFKSDGKFDFKINKVGRGPKELQIYRDFFINRNKNTINLFDGRKVLIYNNQGDLLRRQKLNEDGVKIGMLPTEKAYFIWKGGSRSRKTDMLIQLNNKFKKTDSYLPFKGNSVTSFKMFTPYEDYLIFRPLRYSNTINKLTQNGVTPYLTLNFEEQFISSDYSDHERRRLMNSGGIYGLKNIYETKNFLFFTFIKKRYRHYCLYSKSSKKVRRWFSQTKNSLIPSAISSIEAKESNYSYSYVEPYYMTTWIKKLKEKVDKKEYQKLVHDYKPIFRTINKCKDTDNPIIIKYKYKSF